MPKISEATEREIQNIVAAMLKDYSVTVCGIEPGEDSGGNDAIFVNLCYALSEREIDPGLTAKLRATVRERLLELDEERFPYILHYFDEKQKVRA
jgi:hypothetical protein